MLHHTRISIGSDDVTMLRLQLFFFHTLHLRHIRVNIIHHKVCEFCLLPLQIVQLFYTIMCVQTYYSVLLSFKWTYQ